MAEKKGISALLKGLRQGIGLLKQEGFVKKSSLLPNYYELITDSGAFGVGFQLRRDGRGIAADLLLDGKYLGRADELFDEEVIGDNFWKFGNYEELVMQMREIVTLILSKKDDLLSGRLDLNRRRQERDRMNEAFLSHLPPEDEEKMEKLLREKMAEWDNRRAGEDPPIWREIWDFFGYKVEELKE